MGGAAWPRDMDKALLARVEKQAWFHRHPRGLPLLLFLVTITATLLGVIAIERSDADAHKLELDRRAGEIASAIERRSSESIAFLNATAAIFSSRDEISPAAFSRLMQQLNAGTSAKGARGVGWARWVDARSLPALEAEMRRRGVPDYHVWPKPASGPAVPVLYLEPLARPAVLGYNMYSDPTRRIAMNRAVATREAIVSGRVHLVQLGKENPVSGFLVFTPVFADTTGNLKGFVYSPFSASEFLASAIDMARFQDLDIAIYDGTAKPENLLVEHVADGQPGTRLDHEIHFGTRNWVLSVTDRREAGLSTLSILTLLFGITLTALLVVIGWLITRRATEDRRVLEWLTEQAAIRTSLMRELNHRVKNAMANVLSIVALTRRRCHDIDEFAESITGRIRALSATHDLLSQSEWSNARIGDIVRSELAPYLATTDRHLEIAGPDIGLAPNDALSLGLIVHELATNAGKYGALSTNDGKVYISWRLIELHSAEFLWREAGGPRVVAPARQGFGMTLIEKVAEHELGSAIDLRFEPGGVECLLVLPVRERSEFAIRDRGARA